MKANRLLSPVLRWVKRIVLAVLILFAALIVFLLAREAVARRRYHDEYPPPGRMVSIDTHDVHLHCVGSGSPTVVFESDLDQLGSLSWEPIEDEVGAFTRACSYDRAGIMWSEPGPRPRDGETIAGELAGILTAAGEEGPYVMVGHAFGGAYVRIFAGENPGAVCGVVLVDGSHPDQIARFSAIGVEQEIPSSEIRPLILFLSRLGMPGRFKGPQYGMSREVYDTQQAFLPESSMAWFDETVEGPTTLAQSGRVTDLGDIPLIVIASARPTSSYRTASGQDPQDTWLELQQELTLLSDDSEIILLEDAGHYIHHDRPEVVIEAVGDLVARCEVLAP